MAGVLDGKVGLVVGVANKRSIAWAIAQAWHDHGAKLAFTYQGERLKENVEELVGTFGQDTAIALSGMSFAMAGVTTSLSQFWCLPTAILAGAAAATGIALINSIGNLAGFLGPWLIGWLVDRTGSTDFGVYALAGVLTLGSMLVLTIPARIVNR